MQAMVKRSSYKNGDMCECEHWLYICLWEKMKQQTPCENKPINGSRF